MEYPVCTLASVISPGKYCVVSNDKEHVSDVKTLEKRMAREINLSEPSEYQLSPQMCVAVSHKEVKFRRGIIEKELKSGLYEVFLMDYGVIVQVEKSKLKVITNKEFLKVEPLAFVVILYGLIPTKCVTVNGVRKHKACREWVPESWTFVQNLIGINNKVVVKSILIQDRNVYGELFVRPNPDKKFMPLRKFLCKNEFCVYSESNFLKQSSFGSLDETQSVGYESKMEFVRKWQRESLPYQKTNRFLSPLSASNLGDKSPHKTSQGAPDRVFTSSQQTTPVSSGNDTPESSAATIPKSLGRGRLKLLIAEIKRTKQPAVENNEDSHQRDPFNRTEIKLSKGRGLLLKKYLEAKKTAELNTPTLTSPPTKDDFQEDRFNPFSEVDKCSECENESVSKVERAVIKSNEFSEFGDSNDLTESSLSTEDEPPPLVRNETMVEKNERLVLIGGEDRQDSLNKTDIGNKSAESLEFTDKILSAKKSICSNKSSETLSCAEWVERRPRGLTMEELPPGRMAAINSWTPYVLFEDSFVKPVRTFAELPVQPSIIKNLEKEGSFRDLSQIQRWAIPAIRKQHSIAVIGSPKTGKTLSYVIPVIDYVQDATYFDELPEGNGPSVVIVASSSRVCESICYMCHTLLGRNTKKENRSQVKVILAHGGGCEKEVWVSLTNGCDILISTPHCLARLLETPAITNLERLSVLVLDEVDVISQKPFRKSLRVVLEKAQFSTKDRHYQKILTGEKLTPDVLRVMETYVKPYALVIGSYSEAIIYEGLKPNIYLVDRERKPEMVATKLRDKMKKSKVLVVCETKAAAVALSDFLAEKGISALVAHENILADGIKEIRSMWTALRNSVLIATDGVLNELNVRDVEILVHYDLPTKSKTNFYLRYSSLEGFLRNGPSFSKHQGKSPKTQNMILVDDENHHQLPHIVDFLARLGGKVPAKLFQKCEEIRRKIEVDKRDVPICENLLSFGRCRKSKTCPHRHALVKNLDSCGSLPTSGWVNFVVLRSHDASRLTARLIEIVDAKGQTSKIEDRYLELPMKLAEVYKNEDDRRPLGAPKVGDVCAVRCDIDGQEMFYRAKIIEYLKLDKREKPLELSVKLIDQGDLLRRKYTELYELPEELTSWPASAVDVVVVGVQPMDCDANWSQVANQFAEDLMTQTLKENQYWSGRIVLALKDTLFLDPIKRKEFLPQLNTHVFDLVVGCELLNKRLAVANNDHLPPLLKLCGESGMEISRKGEQRKDKDSTTVQPQWAFFDSDHVEVKFLAAESTSMIFLQSRKYEKLLQELEEDCQKEGERKAAELKNRKGKKGSSEEQKIVVGAFCLALFEDGKWNRGRIESESDMHFYVFFMDHGDFLFVLKSDVVPIPEALLLRLPCQAVECTLAGIAQQEGCPEEVLREIYAFSEDGREYLYASVVGKDLKANITKGRRYSLNLVNGSGMSLNKVLVDRGMVRAEESERQYLANVEMGEEEEDSSEMSASVGKLEEYLNSLPESIFTDEAGHGFLTEFFSRFLGPLAPAKESETKDRGEIRPSNVEVPGQDSRRLIGMFKKRRKRPKELLLKSRENVLTPQVHWSQNRSEIHLKILLGSVQDYCLECTVSNVSFRCLLGEKFYAMDLRLYGAINPSMTKVTVKAFHVLVILTKLAFPPWPRLHADGGRIRWISLDVESLDEEDEIFSDRIATAKLEIESGMLKQGRRDDDILPCSDSDDSDVDDGSRCDEDD